MQYCYFRLEYSTNNKLSPFSTKFNEEPLTCFLSFYILTCCQALNIIVIKHNNDTF